MSDTPKFLDENCGPLTLVCPNCEQQFLHQVSAGVWFREEDDTHTGGHWITQGSVRAADPTDNPSRRRSGLSIRFECERCEAKPCLNIVQHKGETFVQWADKG